MGNPLENIERALLEVEMPDGKLWCVPVMFIARHRAEAYKKEFGNDVERALSEDTLPLFAADRFEVQDWAANNMNWSDVESVAEEIEMIEPQKPDYEEGWANGTKKFLWNAEA